jgi:hypothetical protein
MTPAQHRLRAAIFGEPTAAALLSAGNSAGLRDYLNGASTFIAWRTLVSQDDIMQNGFDWTRVDNLSIGKARIWEWLFNNDARSSSPSSSTCALALTSWVGGSRRRCAPLSMFTASALLHRLKS